MTGRATTPVVVLAATVVALAGCGGSSVPRSAAAPASAGSTAGKPLVLLAAASLTGVLDGLSVDGAPVRVSYAGSPELVAQVRSGAPADVIVTASPKSLSPLTSAGLVEPPVVVARNTLTLVVPAANPGRVHSVGDLARRGLRVALCDPSVPCGAAAAKTLTADHVDAHPATLAPDVKAVLRAVRSGEADAGLVYATDARAAGASVVTLPLPAAATTDYPAAVVKASRQPAAARRLLALLTGPEVRARLARAGFRLA